jgi:hypothetical protein
MALVMTAGWHRGRVACWRETDITFSAAREGVKVPGLWSRLGTKRAPDNAAETALREPDRERNG